MSFLNYTTQQLQGGGKYSVKTKIGNWYEDMVMDETKFKDYIRLKESNNLMVAKKENKYANLLKKIPLEPFEGVLTTGHYFMLRNHKTNGFMVLDIDDKNINYDAAFAVTTSPLMTFSCPRSMSNLKNMIQLSILIAYQNNNLFPKYVFMIKYELYVIRMLMNHLFIFFLLLFLLLIIQDLAEIKKF